MFPQICKIGPITIYSYGVALVAAFFVTVNLAMSRARKEGLSPESIYNLIFVVFISGIIGARIFYVIMNAPYYIKNPLEMIMLQRGGLAWFGGLIAAVVVGIVYAKNKGLPLLRTMDLIAPFIALGQAIGRIGCFFNGCCWGSPELLIPAQVVSSFLLVLIFLSLRIMQDRPHRQGQIFLAYLLLYSVKRFAVEWLRQDNPVVFAHLTLFHLSSLALFVLSIAGLVFLLRKK